MMMWYINKAKQMHYKFGIFLHASHMDCSLQFTHFKKYCIRNLSTIIRSNVPLKSTNTLKIPIRRNMIMARRHFDKNSKQNKRDKVPDDYELIYQASLRNYIKYCSYIVFVTNLTIPIIIACSYSNYTGATKPYSYGPHIRKILPQTKYESALYFTFLFLLNVSIIIFYRKYALRIYNSGTNYVAIYSDGIRPWKICQHYFTDAVKKELRIKILVDSYHILGNKKLILMEDGFRYPIDYFKMLKLQ